jgi:hypothetical protein
MTEMGETKRNGSINDLRLPAMVALASIGGYEATPPFGTAYAAMGAANNVYPDPEFKQIVEGSLVHFSTTSPGNVSIL